MVQLFDGFVRGTNDDLDCVLETGEGDEACDVVGELWGTFEGEVGAAAKGAEGVSEENG